MNIDSQKEKSVFGEETDLSSRQEDSDIKNNEDVELNKVELKAIEDLEKSEVAEEAERVPVQPEKNLEKDSLEDNKEASVSVLSVEEASREEASVHEDVSEKGAYLEQTLDELPLENEGEKGEAEASDVAVEADAELVEDGENAVEESKAETNGDEDVRVDRPRSPIVLNIISDDEEEDEDDEPVFENRTKRTEKNGFLRGLFETMEMVCIAISVVVLIVTFLFRFSKVDGESMTYTINENDTLIVSMAFYQPQKGDVIIFQAPGYDINKPLVKRIIATEGDTLEINFEKWEIKVNGKVLEEDYVRYHPYLPDSQDDLFVQNNPDYEMANQTISDIKEGSYDPISKTFTAVIPKGHVFAMGDNRNNSHDSRSADIGMVDERFIVGKVVARIAPFSDIGFID